MTASDQHQWLQQLVGQWDVTSEAVDAASGETASWESHEVVRSIGGLWTVAETTTEDDEAFTSIQTLGYDPSRQAFVGSWIDTMQTTMWSYVGHLDETERVLTLEAEGPSIHDPGATAKYRDQIELVGADVKKTTSSMLAADGSWSTFMTVTARRLE